MPRPVPISLIIDDSCPLVHVFACHWRDVHHKPLVTSDGRPMPLWVPNDFLVRFCDVVERRGIAGKFSIVPSPGGLGDVVSGSEGRDPSETQEWIEIVQRRLTPRWSFCPEGITHNLTLDLATGTYLGESENAWSQHQDRTTLTPYLVRQLELVRDAGFDAEGVTSPWVFGIEVEAEYIAALVAAQKQVNNRDFSWYFLHMSYSDAEAKPWIAYEEGSTVLVSVPAAIDDFWWATIDSPRTDPEWVDEIASKLLTRDGRGGKIRQVLDAGGFPIMCTHWQSLFSNGLETGLAVLDELGRRVAATLAGEVEWTPFTEVARIAVREGYRRPHPMKRA
jgi:hypothetical protein